MKKSLLLLVAGAISLTAGAQYAKPSGSVILNPASSVLSKRIAPPAVSTTDEGAAHHSAARTTATCTYSETFPNTVLTTGGWTTSAVTGATPSNSAWHWTMTASSAGHSIGTINSTTHTDGWMIVDGDSLRGTSTTALPAAYLQSPSYNCTALATVRLSFQELFEAGYEDTTLIQVSTSPTFATSTTYPIVRNAVLFTGDKTPNPETIIVDITSAAHNQPVVYIRFVYKDIMGYAYSWLIDDVCVGPLDAHDVGLNTGFLYLPNNATATTGAFTSSIFTTPLRFIGTLDSIYPVAQLDNFTNAVEATVPLTATITSSAGSATPYSVSDTYTALPADASDSIIQFSGYVPNAIGTYTCNITAAVTGDANASNNSSVTTFAVTDTTWQVGASTYDPNIAYYVYGTAASTGGSTPYENFQGARFDVSPSIPAGNDTVSGFGVGFASSDFGNGPTGAAGKVMVQLYSRTKDGTSWNFQGSSVARSLVTSDFSTSSSLHWADFRTYTNYGANGDGNFVLQADMTYAAVVQTSGVTTNLLIYATNVPNATYYNPGYFGQSFTSGDDGGTTFGTTVATGTTTVPLVRMYFAPLPPHKAGVTNLVNENNIGTAFPNPSNTSFSVPFTVGQDTKVTVTLTNVMGQVISVQNIDAVSNKSNAAVFNTTNLAEGIYMYTVQANNERTTNRVVVAH